MRISDWSSDMCSSDLAGRGFRVVAGEVKKLAQDTRAVTGDIDRRIRLLTDEAVAIIENLKTGITQGQDARTGASAVTSALEVISQFVRQFEHRTARGAARTSRERRGGTGCVRPLRSGWSPYN